jgi:hypothetical protein
MDPARMFMESLTPGPELENSQGQKRLCLAAPVLAVIHCSQSREKEFMRVIASLSFASVVLLSAAAAAAQPTGVEQPGPSLMYKDLEYRFGIIFPNQAQPLVRDTTYTTKDGAIVPARQFYLERAGERYTVTMVRLPNGPAIDKAHVDHTAEQILKKGTAQFNYSYCYDPGIRPAAQHEEPNGNQLRASMYMWDNRLYIAEASAPVGTHDALQFEQSITILDPMGNDLDNGQGSPACP